MSGKHELGRWATNRKGYPRFRTGKYRDKYVHRVIWELCAGRPAPEGFHIAHQDFNKLNFHPSNLVCCPPEFNPPVVLRHPYSGRFLSSHEYSRLMQAFA